jgi:putative flippase GtrA
MATYDEDGKIASVKQVFAFLSVGVLNTAFCYASYLLFLYVGLDFPLAMLFASALTLIVSYLAMGRLVFRSEIHSRTALRFIAMHFVGYFVNIGFIYIATRAGVAESFSGLISLMLLAIYTFIVSRMFVFKQPI